jgi:hypothetical protein
MSDTDLPAAKSHLDLEERIRLRAYEIWSARKDRTEDSTPLDDWVEAEREVLGENSHQPAHTRTMSAGHAFDADPDLIDE